MKVSITLVSENDLIRALVRDFAHGLGCPVAAAPASIRIDINDDDHSLVEVLTHVALSAAKAGVDIAEPLCEVRYQHPHVTSEVTLTLRIAEFRIDAAAQVGA
jgi:hypothetical protein